MANILIIEDEEVLARNIRDSLCLAGHTAECVATGEEGIKLIQADPPDVLITDYRLSGVNGLEILKIAKQNAPRCSAIMLTAHGDVATAVQAMKAGASEFLTKPIDLEAINLIVERVIEQQKDADALNYFRDRDWSQVKREPIIGESEAIGKVKTHISRMTATPALASRNPPTILITGETGTGKGLIARAIHYGGPRRSEKFIHVNCTAIADHLAESEFFGHVKGAFTDAKKEKRGLFELADKGTIFLDEIGHMPLSLQATLLSVLEQRMVRPVGGTRERQVDVHVIAATNRNLAEAIEEGSFRQDLFHRLQVLRVEIPPLRDRANDVELLARHFLKSTAIRYGLNVRDFSPDALDLLHKYDWPGNVRELQHAIESATLIADAAVLTTDHFAIKTSSPSGDISVVCSPPQKTITIDFANNPPKLNEIEYQIIRAALEHSDHNLSRAARLVGISRDAIRYRLEKFEQDESGSEHQKPEDR